MEITSFLSSFSANYAETTENQEITVTKPPNFNSPLFVLGDLYQEFNVTLEMKIDNFGSGNRGLFRLTNEFTGKGHGAPGKRQPSLQIDNKNKMLAYTFMRNKHDWKFAYTPAVQTGVWISIQMQQALIKGLWTFKFSVDGSDADVKAYQNKFVFKHTVPPIFENIKAFACDPRDTSAPTSAKIKNVKVWTGRLF